MKLGPEPTRYLELLCSYNNAKSSEETNYFLYQLEGLRPKRLESFLSLDKFRLIADWYHIAILKMINLPDFRNSPNWISRRFDSKIPPTTIKAAIRRLIRLGIIEEDAQGNIKRKNENIDSTTNDLPSQAIRKFHSQMIEKAGEALREQSVGEREISSNTFAISAADLPKAKRMIRKFQDELQAVLSRGNSNEVYQLNIQFFALTKGEK